MCRLANLLASTTSSCWFWRERKVARNFTWSDPQRYNLGSLRWLHAVTIGNSFYNQTVPNNTTYMILVTRGKSVHSRRSDPTSATSTPSWPVRSEGLTARMAPNLKAMGKLSSSAIGISTCVIRSSLRIPTVTVKHKQCRIVLQRTLAVHRSPALAGGVVAPPCRPWARVSSDRRWHRADSA